MLASIALSDRLKPTKCDCLDPGTLGSQGTARSNLNSIAVTEEESLQVWATVKDGFQFLVADAAANQAEASEFMHRLERTCLFVAVRVPEREPKEFSVQVEML